MNSLDTQLRNLAKSPYWQNIYKASKDCAGINLFENSHNLSGLQSRFMHWLSVYEMLYTELSTYEDDLLTEEVINNEYRTDAYLIYRNKKYDYLWKQHRAEEKQAQLKSNRKKGFKNPGKESVIKVDLRREN